MHFRIALLVFILGRTGCCNDGGVHGRTGLEKQPFLNQQLIDDCQALLGKLVFFQAVAESQNGLFIGQPSKYIQLGKLTIARRIEEGLFHGQVTQCEPSHIAA